MARRLVAAVLTAAAILAGCGTPRAPVTPGVVKVVAGENFWGNIAAQIGGSHVQVTSILSSPTADPHLYESDIAIATAATNILFGNIFGVSGSQLLILIVIGLVVVVVMAIWYRPLLFASIDPEAAEARGVPVRRLGLIFLVVLALTVTASFGASNIKASVFITSISFAIYLAARLAGPRLRNRRQHYREARHAQPHDGAYAPWSADTSAATATPRGDEPPGQPDRHIPSGLGWPGLSTLLRNSCRASRHPIDSEGDPKAMRNQPNARRSTGPVPGAPDGSHRTPGK